MIAAVERGDWETVIALCFQSRSDAQPLSCHDELVTVLETWGAELQDIYSEIDRKASVDGFKIKRYFPEFQHNYDGFRGRSGDDELLALLIIAYYIRDHMDAYYETLRTEIAQLRAYVQAGESDAERGRTRYLDLVQGRHLSDTDAEELLLDATASVDEELRDYENESGAYRAREISDSGLTTHDAVKCLNDFRGRTVPFLRGTDTKVDRGDTVLEIGSGTGILSIAAAVAGAESVVGVELNPLTCILSKLILEDIASAGLLERRDRIELLWGDAGMFGRAEYPEYRSVEFDVVISENIYTGMFNENQMQLLSQVIRNGTADATLNVHNGYASRTFTPAVLPEATASAAQLVTVSGDTESRVDEVLKEATERGCSVETDLADSIPYDLIEHDKTEQKELFAKLRFTMQQSGTVNAILIYSVLKLADGEYVLQGENTFLSNDHLIYLNKGVSVAHGDEVILTLGYNGGSAAVNSIFELRKVDPTGTVPDEYTARMNIPARQHKLNISNYVNENNIKTSLKMADLGDLEKTRCSVFSNGFEHAWRINQLSRHQR